MPRCRISLRGLRSVSRSPRSGGGRQIGSCLDAPVDVVTEPDRRPSRAINPNSRLNASSRRPLPPRRRSSNPQGREATMQHETAAATTTAAAPLDTALPVAGIDVSKDHLDVFVDVVVGASGRFGNDEQGVARLLAMLRQHQVRLVVLEATGRYHCAAAAELLDAGGLDVAVVNPKQARVRGRR